LKKITLKNINFDEKYPLLSKLIPINPAGVIINIGKSPVKKLLNLLVFKGNIICMANILLETFSGVYSYFFNRQGLLGINKGNYLNEREFMFILSSSKYMLNISRVLN
jgi:hypothetical protein